MISVEAGQCVVIVLTVSGAEAYGEELVKTRTR